MWRLLGDLSSINVPWVRDSTMVQSSGVEPPASGFWSMSYSSIKTSLCTHHRKQNPFVNAEITLTARNTQMDSQNYAKKRERKEIEVTSGRKCKVKQEESNQASNKFPK